MKDISREILIFYYNIKEITQRHLAKGIISESHLSNYLKGRVNISYDTKELLFKKLDIPKSYLMDGNDFIKDMCLKIEKSTFYCDNFDIDSYLLIMDKHSLHTLVDTNLLSIICEKNTFLLNKFSVYYHTLFTNKISDDFPPIYLLISKLKEIFFQNSTSLHDLYTLFLTINMNNIQSKIITKLFSIASKFREQNYDICYYMLDEFSTEFPNAICSFLYSLKEFCRIYSHDIFPSSKKMTIQDFHYLPAFQFNFLKFVEYEKHFRDYDYLFIVEQYKYLSTYFENHNLTELAFRSNNTLAYIYYSNKKYKLSAITYKKLALQR